MEYYIEERGPIVLIKELIGVGKGIYKCHCGNEFICERRKVKNGTRKSCGCLKGHPIHNYSRTIIYRIWGSMRDRCNNPNDTGYKNYGGRGIKVCDSWNESFMNFLNDMRERPSKNHSIDRIDNDEGYYPWNCRWVTRKEQCRNRRSNVNLYYMGKTQTIQAWSEELEIEKSKIAKKIRNGYTMEEVVTGVRKKR